MDINDFISKNCVKNDAEIANMDDALDILLDMHKNAGNIRSRAEFRADVLKRESELSTALDFGIAIPHAKSAAVLRPSLARLSLKAPIKWGNKDVKTVYLIASPDDKSHLEILSALADSLQNGENNV